MTALIVMLALTLAALVWLWLSFRRDAKRQAASDHAERVGLVRAMRDAGFTGLQRFAAMQANGVTREEIAQAERDAK